MIDESEMTREQKIAKLLKYKNPKDGVIYLPSNLTLNNWQNVNSRYEPPKTVIDTIREIEEEIKMERSR